MRFMLTGGGTAGHAWPIILVAKSLAKNQRAKILYVGSRQGIEKHLVKNTEIPFKGILVGKRRNYFSLANYWDIIKTFLGIIQTLFIILSFRPDVIFAKGGYVTVPILFWLVFFKIPLVIHESDVVIGRANLWAAKKAAKICLGFPIEYYSATQNDHPDLSLDKLIYTGIPVDPGFLQTPVKMGEKLKLLVTGGSQGSSKINHLISEILPELTKKYEVYHVAGKKDFPELQKMGYPEDTYHLYEFTAHMPRLMRDADLVVSRAGANTLAEIAAAGRPSIIIPLKIATGEHQVANAQVLAKKNAAVVLSEEKLTSSSLLAIIDSLMADEKLRGLLGHHAHGFFQAKAAGEIVDLLFEVANENFKKT